MQGLPMKGSVSVCAVRTYPPERVAGWRPDRKSYRVQNQVQIGSRIRTDKNVEKVKSTYYPLGLYLGQCRLLVVSQTESVKLRHYPMRVVGYFETSSLAVTPAPQFSIGGPYSDSR